MKTQGLDDAFNVESSIVSTDNSAIEFGDDFGFDGTI